MPQRPIEIRFWSKVEKTESCWLWTGHTDPDGCGLIQWTMPNGHREKRAIRIAWILAHGPIPDGVLLHHTCPDGINSRCVNPAHLAMDTHPHNPRFPTITVPLDQHFWSILAPTLEDNRCWEWPRSLTRGGYGQFPVRLNGTVVERRTNRVAWLFTYGAIPERMQVLHHCDNRLCCRPSHLWLGTNADNMEDKRRKGRAGYGRRATDLQGRWALRHAACRDCGTTKKRHHSHGRCHTCHKRHQDFSKRLKTIKVTQ